MNRKQIILIIVIVVILIAIYFLYKKYISKQATKETTSVLLNGVKCTTSKGQEGRLVNGVCKSINCIQRPSSTGC